MNGMKCSSWRFKRLDRICLTVYSVEFRGVGRHKTNFDVFLKMEFIDKYARVDGSDDDDDAMFAGGDEVNYSDVEFIDDKTNIQDQVPSHYRIINITRDLQNAMRDCYMTGELYLVCSDLKILFPSAWKKLHTNLMNLNALGTA